MPGKELHVMHAKLALPHYARSLWDEEGARKILARQVEQ
jgi:hypothetical protein